MPAPSSDHPRPGGLVEPRDDADVPRWIAIGLLLALLTGLGSLWFGHPFLTTHTAHVHWPLVGEVDSIAAAREFEKQAPHRKFGVNAQG